VSFAARHYDAIVRDLLTTLTGGTVQEPVPVPADGPIVLDQLADRPFRRVSHVEGLVESASGHDPIPYRFTSADYELIALGDEGYDAIRFRDDARRPMAGTTLRVNYYPVQSRPVALTDVNVGSVVRTLLESVGRELAQLELELEHVYGSAFLETATGSSLDQVVALVGMRRLPAGVPVVAVRFRRDAAAIGRVTVPAGTVVTDRDGNRYASVTELVLEPGESSREVLCAAVGPGVEPIDAGALDRLEVLVAGISWVRNEQPAHRAGTAESDDELRRRARHALRGVARGTVGALEFGLRSVPGVKDVALVEQPNGVAGEVHVVIAWEHPPSAAQQAEVRRRIEELRPAGVLVTPTVAQRHAVSVTVDLVLAGAGPTAVELAELRSRVSERLLVVLTAVDPGGAVRNAQLLRAVLADERIVDATVRLTSQATTTPVESLQLSQGEVLEVTGSISFGDVATERSPEGDRLTRTDVDLHLPVHLLPGVTTADATAAIRLAATAHLASRDAGRPLTLDGLAAAIRDDTRFALDRTDAVVTLEAAGRFLQLVDGAGSYGPTPNESLHLRTLDVSVREGGG
jgi:uncharacterized phage protein gp47/JayE